MVFIKQNINIKKNINRQEKVRVLKAVKEEKGEKLVKERAKKLLNPDQSKLDSNSQ